LGFIFIDIQICEILCNILNTRMFLEVIP